MYRENCETVFAMKMHTIVVSRNEMGMVGPALRAMTGNVNTTLIDGAMCAMPWKESCGRVSTFLRSPVLVAVVASAAISGTSSLRNRFRRIMSCSPAASRGEPKAHVQL